MTRTVRAAAIITGRLSGPPIEGVLPGGRLGAAAAQRQSY